MISSRTVWAEETTLKPLDVDLPLLNCKKEKKKRKKKGACIVRHICFERNCTKFTKITMFHNFLFPIYIVT